MWRTASSSCFPVLFLLEVTLAGVGEAVGEGESDNEGDGGRGGGEDTGDWGGRGSFSSSSISFSNFMSPGGSTLYLLAILPNSKRQRHTSLGCLCRTKPSDSNKHVSPTPASLHQDRKLAVLSRAKKDPDGALLLHGILRYGIVLLLPSGDRTPLLCLNFSCSVSASWHNRKPLSKRSMKLSAVISRFSMLESHSARSSFMGKRLASWRLASHCWYCCMSVRPGPMFCLGLRELHMVPCR